MAIERMKKVKILGLTDDFPRISRGLQHLSMLHIQTIEQSADLQKGEGGAALTQAQAAFSRVQDAMDFLSGYGKTKSGFLEPMPSMTEEELCNAPTQHAWQVVDQALAIEEKLANIRAQQTQIQTQIALLQPYRTLDARVEAITPTAHAILALGTVQQNMAQTFCQTVEELGGEVKILNRDGESWPVFVCAHREEEEALQSAMRLAGFAQTTLNISGTPREEIETMQQRMQALHQMRLEQEQKAGGLMNSIGELQILYDQCGIRQQREALIERTGQTQKTFLLTGWVVARKAQRLREELNKLSEDLYVEIQDPPEGETPPTAVRNGKWLRPFEAITDMYSHPLPTEMDPTAIMAPFFFCFFGMMVSDAGYGILLTIGALLLLKIAKPRGMMGQITAVVAMGGVSTLIWGAVFGGWFGEELLPAIWFVPLEEPIMMLGFCLALGMVHLSAGILAHAFEEWKARRPLDAVCDSLFILSTLWGVPMLLLGWNVGMYVCLFGLAGLLLTGGRAKKGFFGKLMGGLSALYGLTGYLSDILSYSRLFGMGLTTGVIGMVFNTIAGMLMGNPIGMVFAVLVLVVGHVFNLGINALGAYVHACRLQYIEFYGKFFEGGGQAFAPFTYQTKYIQIHAA